MKSAYILEVPEETEELAGPQGMKTWHCMHDSSSILEYGNTGTLGRDVSNGQEGSRCQTIMCVKTDFSLASVFSIR